tara:strand:- start:460 stop:1200 length:741 start_codon:yes stop_codon:yes gene_type:complete
MSEINQEGQILEDTGVNQELGYDNVPVADNGVNQSESYQVDWENESRKFQSMYDKEKSENNKMKQDMEYLAKEFASNKRNQNNSNVNNQSSLPEDEFNPWDAYYKPESPSFKFRQQKEQEVVNQAIGQQSAKMEEQMLLNNTVSELKSNHRMTESEVREFMEWSTDPGSSMTLDTLVDVFKSRQNKPGVLPSQEPVQNSFGAVQAAKEAPRTAGVLQGQEANQPKSGKDQMWDVIMSAGSRTNVLK